MSANPLRYGAVKSSGDETTIAHQFPASDRDQTGRHPRQREDQRDLGIKRGRAPDAIQRERRQIGLFPRLQRPDASLESQCLCSAHGRQA